MSFIDTSVTYKFVIFSILLFSFIIMLFVIIGSVLLHTEPKKRLVVIIFAFVTHNMMWLVDSINKLKVNGKTNLNELVDYFGIVPAEAYLIISILLVLISILFYIEQFLYRKKHITLHSLKESIDYMDKGIIIYDDLGSIFMANRLIQSISYIMSKKGILNGLDFKNMVENNEYIIKSKLVENDDIIVKLPNGAIYSFIFDTIIYKELVLNRIIASNILDEYELNQELEDNIYRLKNYNEELKNYNKNIIEFTRNEELLKAKINIHDKFGELLLSTKRLDESSTVEEKIGILKLWKATAKLASTNSFDEKINNNELDDLLISAKNIGVKVTINGNIPNNQIFFTAIHECLTNTVKHGNGDEMYIDCYKNGKYRVLKCSNNGIVPKYFNFSGGLAGLDDLVKKQNGKMYTILEDKFTLVIELEE